MKTRRLRRNIPRIHRVYTYFRSSEESLFEFWLWFFKLFVLGLFLFEEATESVYGVGGILPLRFGGAGGRAAAEAAELRFEEIFRQPADVRNKSRLGGGGLNLERDFSNLAANAAPPAHDPAEETRQPAPTPSRG